LSIIISRCAKFLYASQFAASVSLVRPLSGDLHPTTGHKVASIDKLYNM